MKYKVIIKQRIDYEDKIYLEFNDMDDVTALVNLIGLNSKDISVEIKFLSDKTITTESED